MFLTANLMGQTKMRPVAATSKSRLGSQLHTH
jgi:hypothetical protein